MPVIEKVLLYVGDKILEHFIQEEFWLKRIWHNIFPPIAFKTELVRVINETIEEYEKTRIYDSTGEKFPFYHSQILFDELNKTILFNKSNIGFNSIIDNLKANSNIIVPSINELESFYQIFTAKLNKDKVLKSIFLDENFKSKIYDLGIELERLEGKIDTINSKVHDLHSETIFLPNNTWFQNQCKSSIYDLGKRYSPALNVELEVSEIFDGLGRTEELKRKITKLFDQLLIKGKKVLKEQPEVKESIERLENHFEELYTLFINTEFIGTKPLPIEKFEILLTSIESAVRNIYDYYITEERRLQKEKNDYQYYHKFGSELRALREFENELSNFQNLIHSPTIKLANNPFLLLDGEAGIGKSHLIGDIVSRRIDKDHESVFLLGQHFVMDEDPWTQIFKRLQINSTSDDFLKKLNLRGDELGKRIVLFIDAINEGRGNYFWNSFARSFINDIKKYEWLGLVLTIRSSYKELIFPEEERGDLGIVEHRHYGFKNIEYEASKLFFDNYKIELPNVPLLHPEFQNPLFLKLFCEGINKAELTRIPDGLQGITSIINFFVKNVNRVLSKPNRLAFSESLNLVQKAIDALLKYKVDNHLRYVPYETAYQVIDGSISSFLNKKGFIDDLIIEGVLSKNLFWKEANNYEEGVYLAYERFEDHLTVRYLLEHNQDLEKEFQVGGKLHRYVKDEHTVYINKGLIEAFSTQVPEKNGYEFYALIPDQKDKYPIVESFVESLLWRKIETIKEESKQYINEFVFSYQGTDDLFWETILAITGIPGHFYNAQFLHKHLMTYSLAERDANWTQFLKYRYSDDSSVKRLIEWAWSETDKSHISDESIKLSSIALAWFHSSTNRKLRDCSTKALICLLQDRLDILIEILKMFEGVNDPYVHERLFAVAYGCALRTHQKIQLGYLSEYIFKTIFNNTQGVVPHILLRDYARGVIEYAHHLDISQSHEISKVRPPYKSVWPEEIPSYDELKEKYDNDQYWHLWSSVMGFGDFSRYIIGTNSGSSEWSGCKVGEIPVDREQVFEDFKKKLNTEQSKLLDSLDPILTEETGEIMQFGEETIKFNVAVGRKTEEDLKQTRDDFKKLLTPEILSEYETEIEPYLDHNHKIINTGEYFDLRIAQRLILSRVIELGWDPELHLSFDKEMGTGRVRDSTLHERIGKKYQWIAYHQYMAMLSDNFVKKERYRGEKDESYQGPWDPYTRDIDPTMLISKTGSYDDEHLQEFWWVNNEIFSWDYSNEDWVNDSIRLPNIENTLLLKDHNGDEWLLLEGYPSWSEPKKIGEEKWDQPHKELWCQIRSYIVKDDEFNLLKDWAVTQDFMGRWMPESGHIYEMFSREYYWSPAQDYFTTEYYGGNEWTELHDNVTGAYVATVNVTAQGFSWSEEYDKSKEESIGFLKPSKLIFDGMKLIYAQKEGEFINDSNKVLCFAPDVYENSKSHLLVKKTPFLKFLQDKNLKILWTVLGEKQIIGGRSFNAVYPGRLEISGAYYFEGDKLSGRLNTKHE